MQAWSTEAQSIRITPSYCTTWHTGSLRERISKGRALMKACELCPRKCGNDRYAEVGTICRLGVRARVSSFGPHFGEEACLSGWKGSGTIFFSGCNLRCVFCQNGEISHQETGKEVTAEELAGIMLALQRRGCHNINLVTPSHVVVPILEALAVAIPEGLSLPLVYNTSAYDSQEVLELLDGIVDIYMPDFKFWTAASARRYLKAPDYPVIARRNLQLMHEQVGRLKTDTNGLAYQGVLLRHLVMPGYLRETEAILHFLSQQVDHGMAVNVMLQYHPAHRVGARTYPEIHRLLNREERRQVLHIAHRSRVTIL